MSEPSGWLAKLRSGLARSSDKLGGNLSGMFGPGVLTTATLDQDRLDGIEEALIASDLGPALSGRIVAQLAPERYPRGIDEAGLRAIVAVIRRSGSLVDRRPCVVLDYSATSVVARGVRDEIRLVSEHLYLGVVWLFGRRVAWFTLRERAPGGRG